MRCLFIQRPYNLPDRDPTMGSKLRGLPATSLRLHASSEFLHPPEDVATPIFARHRSPPSADHMPHLHKTIIDSLSTASKKIFFSTLVSRDVYSYKEHTTYKTKLSLSAANLRLLGSSNCLQQTSTEFPPLVAKFVLSIQSLSDHAPHLQYKAIYTLFYKDQ